MPAARSPSSLPRYQQVAEALIADIRSGRFAVGERLPGELALVRQFDVSRHTVRESLRVIEELGMIARKQGLGTVVTSRDSREAYVQTIGTPAELMRYPENSRLTVVEKEEVTANRTLARLLGCKVGERWTRIGAVRKMLKTDQPICWVNIYVVPEYSAVAGKLAKSKRPVYEIVETTFGESVVSVDVEFVSSRLEPHAATMLEVEPGTASMILVRRYLGEKKRHFEVSVAEHPADRFNVSLKLERRWQSTKSWAAAS